MNVCPLHQHELMIDPVSFPHGYAFSPGVVTTVEPGFYKEGEFGVRTESLFVCKEVEASHLS
jgi:Xaa-Pro aminopeptidase